MEQFKHDIEYLPFYKVWSHRIQVRVSYCKHMTVSEKSILIIASKTTTLAAEKGIK